MGATLREAALFVYKYLVCSGWQKKKKVVEEESLWLSCCWALWSGPSTVPGALRAWWWARLKQAAPWCPPTGFSFCGVCFTSTGLNVLGPRAHGVLFLFSINISLPHTQSPGHTHLMQCLYPGQYKEWLVPVMGEGQGLPDTPWKPAQSSGISAHISSPLSLSSATS